MRFLFASFFVFVGLWPTQSSASTYYVDLNTVPQVGNLYGPCYCGSGPLYEISTLPYQSGDFINFGTVKVYSVFDDHSFGRAYPLFPYYWESDGVLVLIDPQEQAGLMSRSNYQGGPGFAYGPNPQLYSYGSLGAPLGSFQTFSLDGEVPAGATSILIGWDGPGVYTAPAELAAAVPEPSTWAMLLIGFAGVGFVARHGRTIETGRWVRKLSEKKRLLRLRTPRRESAYDSVCSGDGGRKSLAS